MEAEKPVLGLEESGAVAVSPSQSRLATGLDGVEGWELKI